MFISGETDGVTHSCKLYYHSFHFSFFYIMYVQYIIPVCQLWHTVLDLRHAGIHSSPRITSQCHKFTFKVSLEVEVECSFVILSGHHPGKSFIRRQCLSRRRCCCCGYINIIHAAVRFLQHHIIYKYFHSIITF